MGNVSCKVMNLVQNFTASNSFQKINQFIYSKFGEFMQRMKGIKALNLDKRLKSFHSKHWK